MAEETLKYNVEIDETSLSEQLERVREQIDSVMGSLAFSSDESPSASALTNPSSIYNLPETAPPGFLPSLERTRETLTDNYQVMAEAMDKASEETRLGFSRFQEDYRRVGLLTEPPVASDYAIEQELYGAGPNGLLNSALSQIAPTLAGFDYDKSGMTKYQYQQKGTQYLLDNYNLFEADSGLTTLATTIGLFAGGPMGALSGYGIGSLADLATNTLFKRVKENESLAKGISTIAEQNFGPISKEKARDMAKNLQERVYSFEGRALKVDFDKVQENIATFASAGGFSQDTSPEEMEKTMLGLVDNARQFANKFRLRQEEAVQVMAELNKSMIVATEQMGTFSTKISRVSGYTGLAPNQVVAFGNQATNMTQGTGILNSQGFAMGIDALQEAERIRRTSPGNREIIAASGGIEQFAYGRMESGLRFMTSGQGMLNMAGLLGGAGVGSTIQERLNAAGTYLSEDPSNFFRLNGEMNELVGIMGQDRITASQIGTAIRVAELIPGAKGKDGKVDRSVLKSIIMQSQNMSSNSAEALILSFEDLLSRDFVNETVGDFESTRENYIQENTPGIFGKARATVGRFLGGIPRAMQPYGEAYREFSDWGVKGVQDFFDETRGYKRFRADMTLSDGAKKLLEKKPSKEYEDIVDKAREMSQEDKERIGDKIIAETLENSPSNAEYIPESILKNLLYLPTEEEREDYINTVLLSGYSQSTTDKDSLRENLLERWGKHEKNINYIKDVSGILSDPKIDVKLNFKSEAEEYFAKNGTESINSAEVLVEDAIKNTYNLSTVQEATPEQIKTFMYVAEESGVNQVAIGNNEIYNHNTRIQSGSTEEILARHKVKEDLDKKEKLQEAVLYGLISGDTQASENYQYAYLRTTNNLDDKKILQNDKEKAEKYFNGIEELDKSKSMVDLAKEIYSVTSIEELTASQIEAIVEPYIDKGGDERNTSIQENASFLEFKFRSDTFSELLALPGLQRKKLEENSEEIIKLSQQKVDLTSQTALEDAGASSEVIDTLQGVFKKKSPEKGKAIAAKINEAAAGVTKIESYRARNVIDGTVDNILNEKDFGTLAQRQLLENYYTSKLIGLNAQGGPDLKISKRDLAGNFEKSLAKQGFNMEKLATALNIDVEELSNPEEFLNILKSLGKVVNLDRSQLTQDVIKQSEGPVTQFSAISSESLQDRASRAMINFAEGHTIITVNVADTEGKTIKLKDT